MQVGTPEAWALETVPGRGPGLAAWGQLEEGALWQVRLRTAAARARQRGKALSSGGHPRREAEKLESCLPHACSQATGQWSHELWGWACATSTTVGFTGRPRPLPPLKDLQAGTGHAPAIPGTSTGHHTCTPVMRGQGPAHTEQRGSKYPPPRFQTTQRSRRS